MEEVWIEIKESDLYELSNYGNIRDKYTKVLKSFTYIKNGTYKAYCLNGKQYLAHRLVAKYFVDNPNPSIYNMVNHLDENTHNNYYLNLKWCTNKENLDYSNCSERVGKKLSKNKIIQYDINGNIIKIWRSKEECSKYGYDGVKSAIGKNSFNRYFSGYFWFKDNEPFDKTRYKPVKIINIYKIKDNKLIYTGGVRDCAIYLNVPDYKINNAIKRGTIIDGHKLIVSNSSLEHKIKFNIVK